MSISVTENLTNPPPNPQNDLEWILLWACSSAGRAPALQAGGHRFDPGHVHHFFSDRKELSRFISGSTCARLRLLHRNCAQWKREQISRFHWCDLIRLTVQLGQSFAFHLQFHLRILLKDLRVALTKHLGNPLISYSSGTEPCCIRGPEIVEPKVGNLRPAKCSSPDRFESRLKSVRVPIARVAVAGPIIAASPP
jgi:hypothetical protein